MKALGLAPDAPAHPSSNRGEEYLIDALLRETYRDKGMVCRFFPRHPESLRRSLTEAKRFVLDDSMAAFVADLSTIRFKHRGPDSKAADYERGLAHNAALLTSLRHSAIPPFPRVWVEMPMPPFVRRLLELKESSGHSSKDIYGDEMSERDVIPRIGWLFEKSDDDRAVIVFVFGFPGQDVVNNAPFCLPFSFLYKIDDVEIPDSPFGPGSPFQCDTGSSAIATGIMRVDRHMAVINHRPIPPEDTLRIDIDSDGTVLTMHKLLPEFGGTLRRALAFMAALDSIPKVEVETRTSKGFLARGQIRKFLPRTTLTLSLPTRVTPERLAGRIIEATHLRWHEVRSHWRVRVKAGGRRCEEANHLWSAKDNLGRARCSQCDAVRTWITIPNGRGDRSLGQAPSHQYSVTKRH